MKKFYVICGKILLSTFINFSLFVGLTFGDNGPNHRVQQSPLTELGVQGGNEYDIVVDEGCYIGTLGSLVTKGGKDYILSNNHVLARSNDASLGEEIKHTVSSYCSSNAYQVGTLAESRDIDFIGDNTIDAAIAEINTDNVSSDGSIMDIGILTPEPATPSLRMGVKKSGRTTGLTKSKIGAVGVNVNINYGDGKVAYFTDQILINGGKFSAPGDSGSLIVTNTGNCPQPVGLLFAGGAGGTIANQIINVINSFNVNVVGLGAGDTCPSDSNDDGGRNGNGGGNGNGRRPTNDIVENALAIRDQHIPDLEDFPEVVGTGIGVGDKGVVIEVYVESITSEIQRSIPRGLDGIPVRLIKTGQFYAY